MDENAKQSSYSFTMQLLCLRFEMCGFVLRGELAKFL